MASDTAALFANAADLLRRHRLQFEKRKEHQRGENLKAFSKCFNNADGMDFYLIKNFVRFLHSTMILTFIFYGKWKLEDLFKKKSKN